jgi:predicted DNA-binding mobile mystery protein A
MPVGSRKAAKARPYLDRRLNPLRAMRPDMAAPAKGWIRAIREGLGMTAVQLARRLGVTQATLSAMEASEARGSIQLSTLRRAAEAMHCTLAYVLVPNEPLEKFVQDRARKIAAAQLAPIEHTMLLENQGLSLAAREAQLSAYIRETLDLRLLWDKP